MKHLFPGDLVVENETAAALHRVLAYLEEYGWHQGLAVGANGQVCVGVALSMVGGGMCSRAGEAIREAIGKESIVTWNDDPLTTWEMVRGALLKAIEAACRT